MFTAVERKALGLIYLGQGRARDKSIRQHDSQVSGASVVPAIFLMSVTCNL